MYPFKTYHPLVNFLYFVFVIGFSMLLSHPVCLLISFFSGIMSIGVLISWQSAKQKVVWGLFLFLLLTVVNPLYSHTGETILGYLPSQKPITLESLAFGGGAALLLLSVFFHFYVYTFIMTSDKYMYLFKRLPALSLVLTMALSLFPRLLRRVQEIDFARRCMGSVPEKGIRNRAKAGLASLSTLTNRALEDAAVTADSMRARGYGLPGRTTFSLFRFSRRDLFVLLILLLLGLYVAVGFFRGALDFSYFPTFSPLAPTLYTKSLFASHLFLCFIPILIDSKEELWWNVSKSKR